MRLCKGITTPSFQVLAWFSKALVMATLANPQLAASQSAMELAQLPLHRLLDLEVTGASRLAGRRSESAASVSVVTRDEIEAMGWRTLGEALRSIRGVMITNDRMYDYAGVRGFYANADYTTRVLLLVDGQRVNERLYDQAHLGGEMPLEISEIERIEFIPGQGSSVYGANALFGVINVVSRVATVRGGSVGAGAGANGERWWRGHWQHRTQNGGLRVAASWVLRDGAALTFPGRLEDVDTTPEAATGQPVPGLEAERRELLRLRWEEGSTRFSALHSVFRQGVPWEPGAVFGDSRSRLREVFTQFSLQHERALGTATNLTAQLQGGRFRFIGDYAYNYPPITVNQDVGLGRWWGGEIRLTTSKFEDHSLVAGLEWERTTVLQRNFDVDPSSDDYLTDERRIDRAAVFAEDRINLGPNWTLHLGGRFDHVAGLGGAGSPRLALAWQPVEDLYLKAIHGRAFRRANAFEAYYAVEGEGGYVRNPNLGPERVRGNEVSVEWLPQSEWRVASSLYWNQAKGLLILGYSPEEDLYKVDNSGAFAARGAEAEIEYADAGLRWRLNASFNQDRSGTAAGFPELYPRRQLKGTLVLPLSQGWNLGAELQAQGRRGDAPGNALVHLALGGPVPVVGHRPTLQLSVRNVFDRKAFDPGPWAYQMPVLPQTGRRWRLQLDWPLQ